MNKPIGARVLAVLFDLDGTLIDSAPDLAGTGNDMRIARGLAPYPLAHFRPMVGSGARGMVGRAFGVAPSDDGFIALRDEFLQRYEMRMTQETRVFPEMMPVLDALDRAPRLHGDVAVDRSGTRGDRGDAHQSRASSGEEEPVHAAPDRARPRDGRPHRRVSVECR